LVVPGLHVAQKSGFLFIVERGVEMATELEQRIRAALNAPDRPGTRVIARQFGVSRPTVLRIAGDGL
jgi:hypothetical protein